MLFAVSYYFNLFSAGGYQVGNHPEFWGPKSKVMGEREDPAS